MHYRLVSRRIDALNQCFLVIICSCIKYESNTLNFSKVMERKQFFKIEKGP